MIRHWALAPLLALLAVPLQLLAHPHEEAADGSPSSVPALRFAPPQEILQAFGRGGERGAMLGIGLGGWAEGAVDGLNVMSVSPGGGADLAGLRSGDLLITFNGQGLSAESGQQAYEKLRGMLTEVEPGTEVTIGYRRGDQESETQVVTGTYGTLREYLSRARMAELARGWANSANGWRGTDGDMEVDVRVEVPGGGEVGRVLQMRRGGANTLTFADMARRLGGLEIIELTPDLGEYFGAEHGLLVVREPDDEDVPLEAGDVIRKIGGREFRNVRHATRILRSYEPGEEVQLDILRHKRGKLVSFQVPERRFERIGRGFGGRPALRPMEPPRTPRPPEAPADSN